MASTTANPLWDIWRRRQRKVLPEVSPWLPDDTMIRELMWQWDRPDPGLWAADERVGRGITIPQTRPWQSNIMSSDAKASMTQGTQAAMAGASGAGSSKWKKVIEQLGKMTGPEPDWGLAGQRVGPASPWSPTNIPYAETAGLMGFRKKKEGPY